MDPVWDVAVVGAGPAGLAAAGVTASRGLTTVVLDEYPLPGGRLLGQLTPTRRGLWVGREQAQLLAQEVKAHAPGSLWMSTSVYAVHREGELWRLWVSGKEGPILARYVVVATGSTEVPLPLPGWTMPGVLTAGAAQTLANVWGISPGRRGLLIGLSPLAFAVALELTWAGVALAGVVPAAPGPTRIHVGSWDDAVAGALRLAHLGPSWARLGATLLALPAARRYMASRLPARGIPLLGTRLRLSVVAEAIVGDDQVQGVRLRRVDPHGMPRGKAWVEPVDFVLLAGGLRPMADLVAAAGARCVLVEELGGEVPLVDPDGATTAPQLFAAGNVLGVEGAAVAAAQGRRAGMAISWREGKASRAEVEEAREHVRQARAQAPFAFYPHIQQGHAKVAAMWQREANDREVR
jgi:sarcosine oxidase subunit alpha